jgi:acyl carrier protein phosphodiesterase
LAPVYDIMNWLAHVLISDSSIDYQLGNLLADPLKGRCWHGASRQLKDGFKMHNSIDAFTDSNAFFMRSKSRLGRKGYLRAVIIDIAYDHCLIKYWGRYSKVDVESFVNAFYENASAAVEGYPDDARLFVKRLIDHRVLASYGTFGGLETAFRRLDCRLSERMLARESALDYLPVLKTQMAGIEEDFVHFFPLLVEHFKTQMGTPLDDHWLK